MTEYAKAITLFFTIVVTDEMVNAAISGHVDAPKSGNESNITLE
jgi:hypothetical protein